MYKVNTWRPFIFTIGILASGTSCYGAYEYAMKLENGNLSYLVIAAPLIALMATLIPPIAEYSWKEDEHLKATLWWFALIPAAALIFFSAAERVHMAKAGYEAEIAARQSASYRAQKVLDDARSILATAELDEAKAKAMKSCNADCREKLQFVSMTREKIAEAEKALALAQRQSIADASIKAPVWLLPVALDIIAFMCIWSALSKPWIIKITRKYIRNEILAKNKRSPSVPKGLPSLLPTMKRVTK